MRSVGLVAEILAVIGTLIYGIVGLALGLIPIFIIITCCGTSDMSQNTPVEHIRHDETRANIPSAELEPVLPDADRAPIRTAWDRRNRDLDPQLVWRGKDPDQATLEVQAPPIYLQEQVHPKALIDDLRARNGKPDAMADLFGHFGLTEEDREAEVEFYRHSRRWSNRMILGDALQVMASLSEREGLRGQVQAIYIDPPYGIRFNSNFQWSTTSRDVKDGKLEHLTREPEQVKAFRDTWRDGIHSYLSYLRDRLGAIGFDPIKHLVLCQVERRPPRLDLDVYPYLPRASVGTTSAASYMCLVGGSE